MNKFIKYLTSFSILIVLLFGFVEYFSRTQTAFNKKKEFLDSNLNSIEVLVLGSSHNATALNPAYIDNVTCNLAFPLQPHSIDYFLLEKYIRKLPRLKTVIFEISPHRFYNDLSTKLYNGNIYSILYGIDYNVDNSLLKNNSFVFANYQYFSKITFNSIKPSNTKNKSILNKYAFLMNDFKGRFSELNYNNEKIRSSYKMVHAFSELEKFNLNKSFIEKTIQLCNQQKVTIVLVTPPFFISYVNQIPGKRKNEVDAAVQDLVAKYKINYLNYSVDNQFTVFDFNDDSHLNSKGSAKFSKLLSQKLK